MNSSNSGAHIGLIEDIFSLMQWGTLIPFIAFVHSRACKVLKITCNRTIENHL